MLSYFFLRDGLVDDIFEAYCKANGVLAVTQTTNTKLAKKSFACETMENLPKKKSHDYESNTTEHCLPLIETEIACEVLRSHHLHTN